MATTASLTTSPTTIDSGVSDNVSVTNTGSVDVVVSRGSQSFTLRAGQGRVIYPEGAAVTAATVSGAGSVSYTATAARLSQVQQFAADPAFSGTYAPINGRGYDAKWSVYGLTDSSMRAYRKAVAQMRRGLGDIHLVSQGDSISHGTGTTATRTDHYMPRAAAALAGRLGVTSRQGLSFPGYSFGGSGFDGLTTNGTGWSTSGVLGLHGANAVSAVAGAAGSLDFAPGVPVDSFNIVFYRGNNCGDVRWAIDGGAYTTITAPGINATYGNFSYDVANVSAGTLGTHTLNIKSGATGSTTYILAVEGVNSTARGVRWFSSGINGKTSTDLAAVIVPAAGSSGLAAAQTDLFLIEIGVNDFQQAGSVVVPTATFQQNLTTIINNVNASSRPASMLLLGFAPPSNVSFTPTLAQYMAAYDAVADATGVPVLHLDNRWGNYATANAAGYFFDLVHPNPQGHAEIGEALAGFLASVG